MPRSAQIKRQPKKSDSALLSGTKKEKNSFLLRRTEVRALRMSLLYCTSIHQLLHGACTCEACASLSSASSGTMTKPGRSLFLFSRYICSPAQGHSTLISPFISACCVRRNGERAWKIPPSQRHTDRYQIILMMRDEYARFDLSQRTLCLWCVWTCVFTPAGRRGRSTQRASGALPAEG